MSAVNFGSLLGGWTLVWMVGFNWSAVNRVGSELSGVGDFSPRLHSHPGCLSHTDITRTLRHSLPHDQIQLDVKGTD